MRVWELGPGRLMVAGAFADLAVHHHPAAQITVGGQGPLALSRDGDAHEVCRLVVIASGARHAVRSDSRSGAWTLYFGLQTWQGVALNTLTRNHGDRGVWIVDDGQRLAEAATVLLDANGPHAAADFVVDELRGMDDRRSRRRRSVHPQLRVPQHCRPTTSDAYANSRPASRSRPPSAGSGWWPPSATSSTVTRSPTPPTWPGLPTARTPTRCAGR
jgi:hypothetical protein